MMTNYLKKVGVLLLSLFICLTMLPAMPAMAETAEAPKTNDFYKDITDVTEPELKDGVYQIATGADLAWLAQKVNDGTGANYNAILTKDIDLGGESWTPIGKKAGYYSSNAYQGTFDGNGKTIQGLHVDSSESAVGLFGIVSGATIKDLTVKGDVKTSSTSSYSAGAGGIAGTIKGSTKIQNCVNYVTVTGGSGAGGIVGAASGYSGGNVIDSCVNYGAIEGNNSVGGIIGNIDDGVTVSNSYNRATVNAKVSKAGGIAGYLQNRSGKIENCYTTGTVTGSTDANPVVGKKENGSVDNVYFLDTLGSDSNATAISDENLKKMAFDPAITAFSKDMETPVNDGYPILDFQDTTPKFQVTFVLSPEEAELTVKDVEGFKMAGKKDGNKVTYKLKDGTYSYTANAFGKKEAKGEIEVKDAALEKTLTLEDAPSAKVKFNVTYSDGAKDVTPTITVKTGDRVMEAAEDGTYTLPYGYTYDYVVKAKNYKKVTGSITADDSTKAVIDIEMEYSKSWDGESATATENMTGSGTEEDPYQIKSGEDLKWLANRANSGQAKSGEYYKLMDDINLGDNPWTPIGNGYDFKFRGIFDGNGKKITGLFVDTNSMNYPGLFGNVTGDETNHAEIKNLTVSGEVRSSSSQAAGIAWNAEYAEFTGIESHVDVTNTSDGYAGVGGIIGRSYGNVTVSKCGNYGTISAAKADDIGGIVGKGEGSKTVVTECFNTGKITGDEYVGGIVGKFSGTNSKLTNCYNTGDVAGNKCVGGITGSSFAELSNCYSTGQVTGTEKAAAVVGTHGSAYVPANTYCLEGSEDDSATKKTPEAFKALSTDLNANSGATESETIWVQAPERFNSGYPVFTWQKIPADTSKLDAAIQEAEKKSESLTEEKYADVKAELDQAIKAAKKALADEDATEESLASAEKALDDAVTKADTDKKAIDDKYAQAAADKKAAEEAGKAAEKADQAIADAKAQAEKSAAEAAKAVEAKSTDATELAAQAVKDAEAYQDACNQAEKAWQDTEDAVEKAQKSAVKEDQDLDALAKKAAEQKKAAEDAKTQAAAAVEAAKKTASDAEAVVADIDSITPNDVIADQAEESSKVKASKITKTAYSGKTSVKLTLQKVSGAANYRIAYKKASAKKYSYKWTKGKTTYTLKGLKAGEKYDIRVAVYEKADGKWIRSKYSSVKRVFTMKLASKKIKASHAKKTVTVKIAKTKGVSGYYITYSAKKSMKASHTKYFKAKKSGVYKINKLAKAKYYVQAAPVKVYKGHKYTGLKSAKKTAK